MRLQKLDLNLLVMLDILIQEGSVSLTAQRLKLTQPAISNALARLRAHFDDELFVLMDRKMVPTPLCRSLAEPVRRIMSELSLIAAARAEFDPSTTDRTVTIVCSDYVFLVFLSRAIRELAAVAPGVCIRALLTSENMGELLRNGRADFGIFPEKRMVEGLPHGPLFADTFSVIAWRRNSQLKAGRLTAQQYLSLSHVSTSIGPNTPAHIEQESLDRLGINRNIAVYAPNFTSIAEVVLGTDYIATMHTRSARILAERMDIVVIDPPMEISPFQVCLQWHPGMEADPGLEWVRDYLIRAASRLSWPSDLESGSSPSEPVDACLEAP